VHRIGPSFPAPPEAAEIQFFFNAMGLDPLPGGDVAAGDGTALVLERTLLSRTAFPTRPVVL